jgi:hypothetical protein
VSYRYPFPNDPGAQVPVAQVVFAVRLSDGREVCYTGHATRADYEMLHGMAALDLNSPSGTAQSARTTIDWVSGSVRRADNLADWSVIRPVPELPAAQPAIEP